MNARPADEGRSFMSKKGGGTKLGEKIMDERITFYTDPFQTEVPAAPWTARWASQKKNGHHQERRSCQSFLRSILGLTKKCGIRPFSR